MASSSNKVDVIRAALDDEKWQADKFELLFQLKTQFQIPERKWPVLKAAFAGLNSQLGKELEIYMPVKKLAEEFHRRFDQLDMPIYVTTPEEEPTNFGSAAEPADVDIYKALGDDVKIVEQFHVWLGGCIVWRLTCDAANKKNTTFSTAAIMGWRRQGREVGGSPSGQPRGV